MPFRSRVSIASALSNNSYHNKGPDEAADPDPDRAISPDNDDEMNRLPPPVLADRQSEGRRSTKQKKTRISLGLSVRWERFLRKIGNGTAPSTSSAIDESTGESSGYNRSRGLNNTSGDPDALVDEVVVDREWSGEIKSSVHSEHGGSPEKSGGSGGAYGGYGGTNTDRDSLALHAEGVWATCSLLVYLRYRTWPNVYGFFATHFIEEKSEQHYRKENWFLRKSLALWSAAFYVANWGFGVGFIPHPAGLADKIFYYGIAPAFTFPLFFMVVYDWPRDRRITYQLYLSFSTWMWSTYQVLFMYLSGFYGNKKIIDGEGKDFLSTFYYTSALQTIALFGLGFNRFPAMIGVICFLGVSCGLLVPLKTAFLRNEFNFILFQCFLLYVHFMRENAERRLYTLRDQLKVQFRATQKAQVNERKAADSKRRLTSYVFHEVRVPLNTALLAVQNMDASGAVAKTQEIEFKALEGSLSMMSKVLNDVLDFNRMDSGRFESVLKPYAFHQVMRSLFVPLQLATDARGLEFITDLDPAIDEVARTSLLEAQGDSASAIARQLSDNPEEDGFVVGDETRLRQIITNLASNACKFTPSGGKLMITTRLIVGGSRCQVNRGFPSKEAKDLSSPSSPGEELTISETPISARAGMDEKSEKTHGLSATLLNQHDVIHSKPAPLEWIVVRIEVTDTGCGIRQRDMVHTKLFSAFNQTEQGRQQGGKGTGLGLALVRQIVKRSGGRLGLRSKINEGSTFWVELPLGVGSKVIAGLNSPEARFTTASDIDGPRIPKSFRPGPPSSPDVPSRFSPVPPSDDVRASSALHSIMEQGGLVEISTKSGGSEHTRVPTRTIGDFSTGTDATHTHSSVSEISSSPPTTPAERPNLPPESSDSTIKPSHLELPKPTDFGMTENEPPDAAMVASPASERTNGSVMSALSSSAQFEPGLRVLVVDDDPLTRKLMTRMLTRLGCKVTTAENGEIALDLILHPHSTRPTPSSEDTGGSGGILGKSVSIAGDEPKYAIVFLDNQMPVMSGLEAVSKLRKRGRRDFVVGVTGNALLTDQEEYLHAGVDHVLTKPVLEKSIKAMLAIADERRKRGTPPP